MIPHQHLRHNSIHVTIPLIRHEPTEGAAPNCDKTTTKQCSRRVAPAAACNCETVKDYLAVRLTPPDCGLRSDTTLLMKNP